MSHNQFLKVMRWAAWILQHHLITPLNGGFSVTKANLFIIEFLCPCPDQGTRDRCALLLYVSVVLCPFVFKEALF